MSSSLRVLLCGHKSFAARALPDVLRRRGHAVTSFTRGPMGRRGDDVTGPVARIHENEHLAGPFDVVINYIVLKDELIDPNLAYLKSLTEFCRIRNVPHLVHISSVSVYAGNVRSINESSPIETDPKQKGSYGALKVAQDLFLVANTPAGTKLTFARPGFVLAPGLIDPIVGMAARLPNNKLLCIGAAKNQLPCIRRDVLDESIAKIAERGPEIDKDVYLLCDKNSPTKGEWIQGTGTILGCGTSVVKIPTIIWLCAGIGGAVVAKVLGMPIKPYRVIKNACRVQTFDSSATERRLGLEFKVDWRRVLSEVMDDQEPNFQIPYPPMRSKSFSPQRITYIGFGGIVKQKHQPALKKLNFRGQIDAFDLEARTDPDGQVVQSLRDAGPRTSDLYVIASPGRAHGHAIPLLGPLPGPVLIEKPLCYDPVELDRWRDFAKGRDKPVTICHNYRFKRNVELMLEHLRRYNPGKLLHVDLNFQSLPVSKHFPAWRRDERGAQTLLIEYGLHFLDVACMFWSGAWELRDLRWDFNKQGQTGLIEGRMTNPNYSLNFILRQGFIPRKARILFTFQNYATSLGFFPDTFVPHMAGDGSGLHKLEKKAALRSTLAKISDKLRNKDSDQSHPLSLSAATGDTPGLGDCVTVERLYHFYRVLFEISKRVYGDDTQPTPLVTANAMAGA